MREGGIRGALRAERWPTDPIWKSSSRVRKRPFCPHESVYESTYVSGEYGQIRPYSGKLENPPGSVYIYNVDTEQWRTSGEDAHELLMPQEARFLCSPEHHVDDDFADRMRFVESFQFGDTFVVAEISPYGEYIFLGYSPDEVTIENVSVKRKL